MVSVAQVVRMPWHLHCTWRMAPLWDDGDNIILMERCGRRDRSSLQCMHLFYVDVLSPSTGIDHKPVIYSSAHVMRQHYPLAREPPILVAFHIVQTVEQTTDGRVSRLCMTYSKHVHF